MSSVVPNSGAVIQLIRRLHFYIGLFVAPFIFIAALTGTAYVLTPQLENYLYRDALYVEPQGEAHSLAEQVSAARHYVGESARIYALRPAPTNHDTTRVQFVPDAPAVSGSRAIFIDPWTLAVKGDMAVYGTSGVLPLRSWLDRFHQGLLLGDVGRNYSELAASWLWVAALGGVVLWRAGRPRRVLKRPRNGAGLVRHWHQMLGLILLLGLLFFSVTGLTWSQWAGNNIDQLRTRLGWLTPQVNSQLRAEPRPAPADPHAGHHTMPMSGMPMAGMTMGGHSHGDDHRTVNAADGEWDRVLSVAREAGIGAAKVELRQPVSPAMAWTVTEIDRQWPTRVDAVSVSPVDHQIIDHVRFADFPLVAKLTRWGVDAHMGVLFGLPNQLILAAFGMGLCLMILMGYRLWWLRRPASAEGSPVQTLISAWLPLTGTARLLVIAISLGLGIALPVMGWSLLALVVVDFLRWRYYKRGPSLIRQHGQR